MMKKVLVVLFLVGVFFFTSENAQAQEVGVRFGQVVGGNVGIDAMFSAGKFSRIHADVSFGNGVGVEALWDFLYRPLGGEAFNWYVGVGPSLLINDPFFLGVSGEVGLDYHFNGAPIAIGVDWRPTLWIIETTNFSADGFGLNVRYVF